MEGYFLLPELKNEHFLTKKEVLVHNIQKIGLISKVSTIVIVVLVLFTSLFSQVPFLRAEENFSFNYYLYLLLIAFNVVILYFIHIRKVHVTEENIKIMNIFVNSYVIMFISLGSFISIRDSGMYNQLMLYTFILLICCTFLVLKAVQMIVPIVLSSCIILIGLYLQNGGSPVYKHQLIYLLSLQPIAFSISRAIYYNFNRSLKFQNELVKEAHNTRELTNKLREANRMLELQASLDPLTNLFNRRAFNEYLQKLEHKMHENEITLTAIMIDVDCFKLYNDTYGHTAGDNVLIKIGRLLYDIGEKYSCFASRWGGEEFSLLLVNQNQVTTDRVCKDIIKEVNRLQIQHSSSFIDSFVTVSIGACTQLISEGSQIYTCIHQADEALYTVKEKGRNSFKHYHNVHV